MNYDVFFSYQILNTNPWDFANWLKSEFLRSCPKELVAETQKLKLFAEIDPPDEAYTSYHFYLVGLAHYGNTGADLDKDNGEIQQSLSIEDLRLISPDIFS